MRGTVFIAEDSDDDDPLIWSGRFSAHCEAPDGRAFTDGPQGVPLDAVIAWGRSRSDIVLLRVGDSDVLYSAGAQQPAPDDDEDIRPWPEGATVERRRQAGMEHLDLVADEPIPWTVRLRTQLPAEASEQHPSSFSVFARSHAEALERVLALASGPTRPAPLAQSGAALHEDGILSFFSDFDPFDDIRPAD